MLEKFKSIFVRDALEISIGDIPEALSAYAEKSDRLSESRVALLKEAGKLSSHLQALSGKRSADNYVNVLKDRFCEKGIKSLSSLDGNYEDIISSVSQAISDIGGLSLKEFRHFQHFKEDMSKIASQLKSVEEKLTYLKKNYEESKEKKIEDILALSKKIQEKENNIFRMESELLEIEKAIPFIKDSIEKDERKLAEISNKLSAISSDTSDITGSLEQEKSIIKQRIGTEFSGLDRIFKRELHEDPKKYVILEEYIHNAGEAFIRDEDLEIRTILEDLKGKVKKEDPEKYEKLVELLRNIDFFDSLRSQYKGLLDKINKLKDDISKELIPLEKEKNHLLGSIEENKAEISQLLSKRDAKTEEKSYISAALIEDRNSLKSRLEELMQREIKLN